MNRRLRRRVLLLALVLGIPLVLLGAGAWYLASGQLERLIAAEYSKVFPGQLSVEQVELEAGDQASVRHIVLQDGDGREMVQLPHLQVSGSLWSGKVSAIHADGFDIHLGPERLGFIDEFVLAIQDLARHSSGDAEPVNLAISLSNGILWSGTDWQAAIHSLVGHIKDGIPSIQARIGIGEEELRVELGLDDQQQLVLQVGGVVPSSELVAALSGIGIDLLAPEELAYLPSRIALNGSQLRMHGGQWSAHLILSSLAADGVAPVEQLTIKAHLRADAWHGEVRAKWVGDQGEMCCRLQAPTSYDKIQVQELTGNLPVPAVAARLALHGLLNPSYVLALPFLPSELIWKTGAVDVHVRGRLRVNGRIDLGWDGGQLGGQVAMEKRQLQVSDLALLDAGWGKMQGQFRAHLGKDGRLSWDKLQFGTKLSALLQAYPILKPLNDELPKGQVYWQDGDAGMRTVISMQGDAKKHLELVLKSAKEEGRLTGEYLPLTLINMLVPQITVTEGIATKVQAQRGAHGWELDTTIADAEVRMAGWALHKLNAKLTFRALAEDRFSIRWVFADELGSLHYEGTQAAGDLVATINDLPALMPVLDADLRLPATKGSMRLFVKRSPSKVAMPIRIQSWTVKDLTIPGWVDALTASMQGDVTWWEGQLEGALKGQVSGGHFTAGGFDIPLGTGEPEWQAQLAYQHDKRSLKLAPLLLRNPKGSKKPDFALSARGDMQLSIGDAPTEGSVQVVIDPLDLGWLRGKMEHFNVVDDFKWTGKAGMVLNLLYAGLGKWTIDGWILPRQGGFDLYDGLIKLTGLRGTIRLPKQAFPPPAWQYQEPNTADTNAVDELPSAPDQKEASDD